MARTKRVHKALLGVPVSLCVRPAQNIGHNLYRLSYRKDRQPVVLPFLVEKSGLIKCTFSGVQSNYYWSATTNANDTSNAWNVNLNNGNTNDKTLNYVWPVRSRE